MKGDLTIEMFDIITIGSATIDVFVKTKNELRKHELTGHNHTDVCYHLGEKLLVDDLEFNSGGGGTNTAVAFSRLGLKTGYIGVLGHDSYAETIVKELKNENVEFLGKIKQGKTGFSVILPAPHDRVVLSYKGVNNELSWNDLHIPLETKWLYISSMLGKGFNTIEKLSSWAKRNGINIALNISQYLANQGLPKLKRIISNADIFILNKEEASALTGKKHVKEMIEALNNHINGITVITDGTKAIHALSGGMHYMKEVNEVKVVDSTGAGDAFASGFVYGIIEGKGVEKALDYGCREAKSVLSSIGAKNILLRHLG